MRILTIKNGLLTVVTMEPHNGQNIFVRNVVNKPLVATRVGDKFITSPSNESLLQAFEGFRGVIFGKHDEIIEELKRDQHLN